MAHNALSCRFGLNFFSKQPCKYLQGVFSYLNLVFLFMRSGWLLFIALFLVVLGAFALRAPQLELRPMHGDEAVHAIKFRDLWTKGQYAYDANEYHGPTLYDFAIPVVQFAHVPDFKTLTAATLRIVPVIFGTLLISLLWLLHDGFGARRWTVFWAALLTALSPMFVFYARYFIQETLLVCFTLGFIACLWRARESEISRAQSGWCIGAGAFAGLMLASKETAIIALVCIAFAWFLTLREKSEKRFDGKTWLWPTLTAIFVAALLFSNFGRRPQGALDALLAFGTYFTRAGLGTTTNEVQGALHRHPWFQYLEWLLWYHPKAGPRWTEIFAAALFVIGLICVLWSLFKRADEKTNPAPLARFFAIYSLSMFLIYSAIPYKTPWSGMGFWQGALIISGFGAAQLLHGPLQVLARWPIAARIVQLPILAMLGFGCWQLYGQVQLSNTRFFADGRNPWVYSHPTRDVDKLEKRINDLVAFSAQKNNTPILVIAPGGDYWPLPWNLRAQNQVGYFETVPDLKGAKPELMIVARSESEAAQQALGPNFEEGYHNEFYGLRPKVLLGLYVKKELWEKFLATR